MTIDRLVTGNVADGASSQPGMDVHDLRLPMARGISRTPSVERIRGR